MKKKTQAPVNPNAENETQEVQVSKGAGDGCRLHLHFLRICLR